uniref:Uncharacterized protein n=1 Tax=Rhizophora mucronata TaxID=61149 RepID=A0A2P2JD87_RHIMU
MNRKWIKQKVELNWKERNWFLMAIDEKEIRIKLTEKNSSSSLLPLSDYHSGSIIWNSWRKRKALKLKIGQRSFCLTPPFFFGRQIEVELTKGREEELQPRISE